MYDDLESMFGGPDAVRNILQQRPILPPSAALVGYFEWQIAHNNAHLLIVLRLLLEWLFSNMSDGQVRVIEELVPGGSRTMRLHREADQGHVEPCYDYVRRNFSVSDDVALAWSLNFAVQCLRESQIWIAREILGPTH
ncbi:MAG: hypothetical protein E5W86_03435 [Mesorhizobium sp.]|nr:MAG: hypothetical protein E5W86_03435 [Mesorhizobium sp.]